MSTVSAFEAKTHFGSILDRVAGGEEIVITRHDKAVARIVPEGGASRESIREAVAGLRATRTRMAGRKGFRPLSDVAIRAAINEGRR
jgi:prevent-host-death family protein